MDAITPTGADVDHRRTGRLRAEDAQAALLALIDGILPPAGTVCTQDDPPFGSGD